MYFLSNVSKQSTADLLSVCRDSLISPHLKVYLLYFWPLGGRKDPKKLTDQHLSHVIAPVFFKSKLSYICSMIVDKQHSLA